MYPQSLLYWLGGTAVLIGVIGLIGLGVWALEARMRKHDKRHEEDEDD